MKSMILLAMLGLAAAIPALPEFNMPIIPNIDHARSFDAIKGHHLRALATYRQVLAQPHPEDFASCYTAFMAFDTIANDPTCGGLIAQVFAYGPEGGLDQTTFDAAIDSFCGGTCASDITTALIDIKLECTDVWDDPQANEDFVEGIRQFISLLRIPCTQNAAGDRYCAKDFYAASIQDDGTDLITEGELESLCVECVYLMFQQFASFASSEEAIQAGLYINLMCLNVDGEYCMIYMQDAFPEDSSSGSSSSSDFLGELDALCHPCVKLVIDYLSTVFNLFDVQGQCAALNSTSCESYSDSVDCVYDGSDCNAEFDSDEATGIFTLLCVKNQDDDLCISEFFNAISAGPTDSCPESETDAPPPKSCSSKCSNAINDMAADLGCCTGYIEDYLNLGGEEKTDDEIAWNDFFLKECANPDVADYAECPLAAVTGTFGILNFATDYFQDNKDDIIGWIVADVALATGASSDNIQITANDVSVEDDGTITVSYTITVTNNDQANYIALTVNGQQISLTKTTASVGVQGKEDFTEALTVTDSVATAETFDEEDWEAPEANTASHVGVGLAAAAVVFNL
jgi:hypothetical protein